MVPMLKTIKHFFLRIFQPFYFFYTSLLYGVNRKPVMIIGLGTGRCGTNSLSTFLNLQPRTKVTHESGFEGREQFKWVLKSEGSKEDLRHYFEKLILPRYKNNYLIAGDIALYLLNYIDWIFELYKDQFDIKIICLRRNRQATVESFVKYTDLTNVHRWADHDGSQWQELDEWDACFPNFKAKTKKEAVEMYWDWYYERAEKLKEKYFDQFMFLELETFSTRETQEKLLDFIEFPKNLRKYQNDPKYNTLKQYKQVVEKHKQHNEESKKKK